MFAQTFAPPPSGGWMGNRSSETSRLAICSPSPHLTDTRARPTQIELPELTSAADVDLDITERRLELSHEPQKYRLNVNLPYEVDSAQGSAKFDKAKRVLSVTLPVVAEVAPMATWRPETAGQTEEEFEKEKAVLEATEKAEREAQEAAEVEARASARAKRDQQELEEAAQRAETRRAAEAAAERNAAKRAAAMAKAEAEAKARGSAVGKEAPRPVSHVPQQSVPSSTSRLEEAGAFEPASSFAGEKPGFIFKKGSQGLGYYEDARTRKQSVAPKESAPAGKTSTGTGAAKHEAAQPTAGAPATISKGRRGSEDWVVVEKEVKEEEGISKADAPPVTAKKDASNIHSATAPAKVGLPSLSNELLFELD